MSQRDTRTGLRSSRREFLAITSFAVRGTMPGPALVAGAPSKISPGALLRLPGETHAADILPEALTPTLLQSLASTAVDAARAAGAIYADVRVAERHILKVEPAIDPLIPVVQLQATFHYGIRVCVDGVWTFVHGTVPAADALTMSAQEAVAKVRGLVRSGVSGSYTPSDALVPAPVVTGTWSAPIRIDPFTVPIESQLALLWACRDAALHPRGAVFSASSFTWMRETRTFASTEGSLVTQTVYRSDPQIGAESDRGMGRVEVDLPQIIAQTGGYETVLISNLPDRVKAAAEESVQLARLPARLLDVGRYPVVFDGITMGTVFGATVGQALELDRVLGDEADAVGTSPWASISDVLGAQTFPTLLNATASRSLPTLQSVQWDDEGVPTHDYSVIADGRIVDFHTSRQTAGALQSWYQQRGLPLRSHGCLMAPSAQYPALIRAPHMTLASETRHATVDTLAKDLTHGVLVRQARYVSIDAQCTSGNLVQGVILEVKKGAIVGRLREVGFEFTTKGLWKTLAALGDETTSRTSNVYAHKGQPWISAKQSTTAPAGFFKEANVVSMGSRI